MSNNNDTDSFYWDPEKQERVKARYRVFLLQPASYHGFIDLDAYSEDEAKRLALDHFPDVAWDECFEYGTAEVVDVECKNPPSSAILIGKNSHAGNLDGLFEPDEPARTVLFSDSDETPTKTDDGASPCK